MKKALSIFLSLVLLLTVCMQGTVLASGQTKLTVSDATCKQGENVSLTVTLENNPGIMFLSFTPACYDAENAKTDKLTISSVTNGTLFSSFTPGKNPVFSADGDVTTNGTLCTLNIAVSNTAPVGVYTVKLTSRGCYDSTEANVSLDIVVGTITVEAVPVPVTGVTLDRETASVDTGATVTLVATVAPENATNKTVSWKSSDDTVATVDANGVVTGVKKGTATITVTTADGSFTDTCLVSVACTHDNKTNVPANPSTCKDPGNNAYTVCDDCGAVTDGDDTKLPLGDHTGGTATCKDKAVCTVCTQPYGDYAAHDLTHYAPSPADHSNPGNYEYWKCDVCLKFFSDAAGETEITENDTVIPVIPHDHSNDWSKNDTQHWNECECGDKTNVAEHKYDNGCDTTCNTCSHTRVTTHNWNTDYSTDANGHWIECNECHERKDEGTHTGGTATCQSKAICTVCNAAYGSLADHIWETEGEETNPPTCQKTGTLTFECTNNGCTETKDEDIPVDVNAHDFDEEGYIDFGDEATCTDMGYTTYDCLNDGCEEFLRVQNVPVDPDNHTYGDWTVVTPPSLTEEGERTATCSGCGDPITEDMPKLVTAIDGDKVVAVDIEGEEIDLDIKFELVDEDDTLNGYTNAIVVEIDDFEDLEKVDNKDWVVGYYSMLMDTDTIMVIEGKQVKVSIKLDANLLANYEELAVYTCDMTAAEENYTLFADAQIVDGYLVFTVDSTDLSENAVLIAGVKKVVEEGPAGDDKAEEDSESPKTGESAAAAVAIVVFAIAASAVVITKKRVRA